MRVLVMGCRKPGEIFVEFRRNEEQRYFHLFSKNDQVPEFFLKDYFQCFVTEKFEWNFLPLSPLYARMS